MLLLHAGRRAEATASDDAAGRLLLLGPRRSEYFLHLALHLGLDLGGARVIDAGRFQHFTELRAAAGTTEATATTLSALTAALAATHLRAALTLPALTLAALSTLTIALLLFAHCVLNFFRRLEARGVVGEAQHIGDDLKTVRLDTAPTPPAAPSANDNSLMSFDMGDLSLDMLGTDSVSPLEDIPEGDPLQTKLSLATEFMAIGDMEGARSLAEEVVEQATGQLKDKARAFLADLG